MLANHQVGTLDEGRIDLPAVRCKYLLNRSQSAEHHAVTDVLLDHLRIEELGQRHSARLRRCILSPPAWRLYPLPEMRQQRRHIFFETICEEQWRRQHLRHVMDSASRRR